MVHEVERDFSNPVHAFNSGRVSHVVERVKRISTEVEHRNFAQSTAGQRLVRVQVSLRATSGIKGAIGAVDSRGDAEYISRFGLNEVRRGSHIGGYGTGLTSDEAIFTLITIAWHGK